MVCVLLKLSIPLLILSRVWPSRARPSGMYTDTTAASNPLSASPVWGRHFIRKPVFYASFFSSCPVAPFTASFPRYNQYISPAHVQTNAISSPWFCSRTVQPKLSLFIYSFLILSSQIITSYPTLPQSLTRITYTIRKKEVCGHKTVSLTCPCQTSYSRSVLLLC